MDDRMAALGTSVDRLVTADGFRAEVHAVPVSRFRPLITNARTTVR
jgi:hypothetical protein